MIPPSFQVAGRFTRRRRVCCSALERAQASQQITLTLTHPSQMVGQSTPSCTMAMTSAPAEGGRSGAGRRRHCKRTRTPQYARRKARGGQGQRGAPAPGGTANSAALRRNTSMVPRGNGLENGGTEQHRGQLGPTGAETSSPRQSPPDHPASFALSHYPSVHALLLPCPAASLWARSWKSEKEVRTCLDLRLWDLAKGSARSARATCSPLHVKLASRST